MTAAPHLKHELGALLEIVLIGRLNCIETLLESVLSFSGTERAQNLLPAMAIASNNRF